MQPQDEDAPQTPSPPPETQAAGSETPPAQPSAEAATPPSQPPSQPSADQDPTTGPTEAEAPASTQDATTPDQAPVTTAVKRPLVPMAAFERIPTRWLVVAGGVAALLIIALGAALLFGGRSGRSSVGAPVQAAPDATAAAPSGPGATGPAGTSAPGSSSAPGAAPGAGTAPGGANQAGPAGIPPASVDALKALLIPPPGTDSTVDTEPITDTTFEGARWGVTLFWANPEGSMVLAQYGTSDEARTAISQYRDSVHQSGICDESPVAGRADAFLCAAKGLGDGPDPGDIPAIGLGLKGTVVALVTASDPTNVQQLLVKQLDRLP